MKDDFLLISRCIKSCINMNQFEICKIMYVLFIKKYSNKNEYLLLEKEIYCELLSKKTVLLIEI